MLFSFSIINFKLYLNRGSTDFDDYPFDEPSPSPNYNPATPGYQPETPQGPYTPQTPGAANMYNSDHTYSPYQQTPSPADYPSKLLRIDIYFSSSFFYNGLGTIWKTINLN